MPDRPKYDLHAYVRRRSAPDKSGLVRERFWSDQTDEWIYKVQFGMPPSKSVPEEDLELVPEDANPWRDLLEGRTEGVGVYQKLLTFERINRPPSRVAESFGTARAKLLPYQFKPLLKFLDSAKQRLLIADDVGLGKTIEAGYILKELKARHDVEQCLVVVPARLREKWRRELEERFDERFELVSAVNIRTRLFDRLERGKEPDPFLWIASYESVRRPEIVGGFADYQPGIDLVILDEAHRVRNPATQQNRMARTLSDCANALLLLSATPVQTHLENLFHLLRLVDSEVFESFGAFERQVEANQPVVRALAKVRAGTRESLEAASTELSHLSRHPLTKALAEEPFVEDLVGRLRTADLSDRRVLVDLQRDIGELSLTSNVLSRTRKVQVMPNRPLRKSQSVRVPMTTEEAAVYEAVAIRFLDRACTSSWGSAMALLSALRLTASCIPAAVEYFARRGDRSFGADADDINGERAASKDDEWSMMPGGPLVVPPVDSKLDHLLRILREHETDGSGKPRKTVVFAFFKPTLRYLSRQLAHRGIEHRVIHGDVPIPERENLIDAFVRDTSIRVLLSSEVGSEGVDLQVASTIVNYDLPWNPMVVEQRIGRLDRIGQESSVISIVNLFERTLGELEDILGEDLEKLALRYLQQELTPDEAERQAEQRAHAFLQEEKQAEDLQDRADQLLAGDQAFLDEVEALFGERRVPSPNELYRFVKRFLDDRFPGCEFPSDVAVRSVEVHLQPTVGDELLRLFPGASDVRRFAARLQAGPVAVTMDSDAYLRVGSAEFVSMHHCLVRLACTHMQRGIESLHRTFQLRTKVGGVQAGEYVLGIIELEVAGIRPRVDLRPMAIRVGNGTPLKADAANALFLASLEQALAWEGQATGSTDDLRAAVDCLRKEADSERARLKESEGTLGALRAARRRATQLGTLKQRVKIATDRLASLKATNAKEFPIRMADRRLRIEQARLEEFTQRTEPDLAAVVSPRDLAVVLVKAE